MTAVGSVYRGVTALMEPFAPPALSLWARKEDRTLRNERMGRILMEAVDTWWHAASLGEVAALEPVLDLAEEAGRRGRFVVTTTTRAGRRRAFTRWRHHVSLAPLDLPRAVRRAVSARRPKSLVFVETELWPNWLAEAQRRKVRVAVINGRLSDRAWPRYRRLRSLFRPLLAHVEALAVRTDLDRERFAALGARSEALAVTGNTKHDRLAREEPAGLPWPDALLWTVGNLRHGESEVLLDAYTALRARHPRLKLALVPRHPSSWPRLRENLEARGLRAAYRTAPRDEDTSADVLVVDTHGELGAYYAASSIISVGGTWVPIGGHNVLEAALAGAPVLFGPHTANARTEANALVENGGALRIETAPGMVEAIEGWIVDPESRREAGVRASTAASSFRGASKRTLDWLVHRGVLPVRKAHG